MSDALQAGADRFRGFGDLYDGVRPVPPAELASLLMAYCGRRPERVVDIGCGTGLSTRWAATWADEVIGVEPSDDMRETAQRQARPGISYIKGWSHQTGVDSGSVDVVLCVQSLHWMEPEATFAEVARILRPGGVFAALDCDWPPVVGDLVAEKAWNDCRHRSLIFERRLADGLSGESLAAPVTKADLDRQSYSGLDPHLDRRLVDSVRSWSKSGHLERMHASGRFAWAREIALAAVEEGNAARFVGLFKSQGDYQALRRHGLSDADLGVDTFAAIADERLGDVPRPWQFVYRIRLAFAR